MSPGVVPFPLSQFLTWLLFAFNDHNKFGGKGNLWKEKEIKILCPTFCSGFIFNVSKSAFLQVIEIWLLVPANTNSQFGFRTVWMLMVLPPWARFLVTLLMGLLLPKRQRINMFGFLLLVFGFLLVFFSLFMCLLINSEFLHFSALLFFCLCSLWGDDFFGNNG